MEPSTGSNKESPPAQAKTTEGQLVIAVTAARLIRLLEVESLADLGWASAVQGPDGKVKTHDTHHDAWADYYREQGLDGDAVIELIMNMAHGDGSIEGFMNPAGEFLTREQALAQWRQDHPDIVKRAVRQDPRDWGDSADLFGT